MGLVGVHFNLRALYYGIVLLLELVGEEHKPVRVRVGVIIC